MGKKITGVFGIQVQRLNSRIGPSGEIGLKSDISWAWTYQRVKGTQQEESKVLSITLAEVETDELSLEQEQNEEDEED